jgi:hypothetical protein
MTNILALTKQFKNGFPRTPRAVLFMVVLIGLLRPWAPAHADITYTFLKMNCDRAAESVTINAFYEENDTGLTKSKNPEKDTYYLTDVSNAHKQIVCDLDNGQTVSFTAAEGALPKDNHFTLYIDGKRVTRGHPLGLGEWEMRVTNTGSNNFTIKYCPDFLDGDLGMAASQAASASRKCKISYVSDDKVQRSEIVGR